MANETLRSVSKRLGITTVDVLRKAAELERLMDVRDCSMTLTSMAKSVICLEIAGNSSQVPVDKNVAIRHSGMTKKAYIHAFKTIECLLGKQKEFTIKDLAVQFGCMEASNLAQRIHQRYKQDFVQEVEDISHPIFVATALYTACRYQKIKMDKTKLLNMLATKRSTFDSLHKKMEKIPGILESAEGNKRSTKRGYGLLEKVNEIIEGQSHSTKQPKNDEEETNAEDREYEEWKKRILESAAKAMQSAGKTNKETSNS
ncbi:Origin of replication complex subunit 6 [Desmophyllum pertusum]|uniref:Origin recognition complex subunit 6 n=1 Tax=Desmophyllum pertusum TaxID=174260 RepID=A0A9W9ZPQ7_9CNID|nr:Origin of replication complex subunit 6 [Desmophyllum pertusum]